MFRSSNRPTSNTQQRLYVWGNLTHRSNHYFMGTGTVVHPKNQKPILDIALMVMNLHTYSNAHIIEV